MLFEFIDLNHQDIVNRTRKKVRGRGWPSVSAQEIEHGVPLFLAQLIDTLRLEMTAEPFPSDAIGSTATRHGAELLAAGFTVAQVVHDYGDICQAITEIAVDQHAPITVEEFHTLNRCLDTAIAEAVTEYMRLTAQQRSDDEVERLGQAAHELRNFLNGALLAFHALKRGAVAISGSTGAVLGRALVSLQDVVDRTLSEVRLAAGKQQTEHLDVSTFMDDIAATSILHSEHRGVRFTVTAVEPGLSIDADSQLLTSAIMNLLHNAFKYTRAGGTVTLGAHAQSERLLIDVQDECGGIQDNEMDLFRAFGDRRNNDRSGLGLGLSIARQAVRVNAGEIHVRNMPEKGCIFTIDLPLSSKDVTVPQASLLV
jgi:signal transduction histidine kinase